MASQNYRINKRIKNIKDQQDLFVIVTEGEKTEPIYFKNFRKRNCGLVIEIYNTKVTSPIQLVKHSITLIKRKDLDLDNKDKLYVIFDVDENSEEDILKAKKLANHHKINICVSNPCFEVWYILHYEYLNSNISRNSVIQKLKKYVPDYEKSKNIYPYLEGNEGVAISHSNKLLEYHNSMGNSKCVDCIPSTNVHFLVEQIIQLIK